jgi:hypothetical protein
MGGSETSEQVLKMKIDGAPRKREATLESAVWQATLRLSLRAGFLEKREKWRSPVVGGVWNVALKHLYAYGHILC